MSAFVYLYLCGFSSERFSLPLCAWDGLRYFIVALPGPSYNNFIVENGQSSTFLYDLTDLRNENVTI